MLDRLKARLVSDARDVLKWWSVRWAALGVVLLPLMQMVPVFPAEVQALLPLWLRAPIAGAWCIGFIAFRLAGQKNLGG